MVLDLIIEDEGGNTKVESKRGKLYSAPAAKAEVLEENQEVSDKAINMAVAEFDY